MTKILFGRGLEQQQAKVSTWYRYLNQQRLNYLYDLKQFQDRLLLLRHQTQIKQEKIVKKVTKKQRQQNTLERQLSERKIILGRLQKQLDTKLSTLIDGKENQNNLQNLIDLLVYGIEKLPTLSVSFAKLKGALLSPIKGFKMPGIRLEKTLVLKVSEGSNVRAIANGRVIAADWLDNYGFLLVIDHGDGYMSLYGRNSVLFKTKGEWVQAGDVISQVGATGGLTGSGLFFEIRRDGRPMSMHSWFVKKV